MGVVPKKCDCGGTVFNVYETLGHEAEWSPEGVFEIGGNDVFNETDETVYCKSCGGDYTLPDEFEYV